MMCVFVCCALRVGPVTTWSEAPLATSDSRQQRSAAGRPVIIPPAPPAVAPPAFAIFTDEPLAAASDEDRNESLLQKSSAGAGLSVRRKLDSAELNVETIAKHPLARHTSAAEASSTGSSSAGTAAKKPAAIVGGQPEPVRASLSTTAASNNASTQVMDTLRSTTTAAAAAADQLQQDTTVPQNAATTAQATAPSAVAAPFETRFGSTVQQHPSGVEDKKGISETGKSTDSAPQPRDTASAEGALSEDAELEQMLAQMVDLDTEDGTINTRIARRDIDSLFCSSPSPQPMKKANRGGVQPYRDEPMKATAKSAGSSAPFMIFDENAAPISAEPHHVVHRPFGTQLSDQNEFSAFKDLSVIKEVSFTDAIAFNCFDGSNLCCCIDER